MICSAISLAKDRDHYFIVGISIMNRREMLKLSLLSGGVVLLSAKSSRAMAVSLPTGGIFDSPSLPRGLKDLSFKENGGFAPNGTVYPQITGNDALTTYRNSLERIVALQQRTSGKNIQFPPQRFYVLNVRQAKHVFSQDEKYKDGSTIWGYDGIYPGPTFMSRYGVPILVRIINGLFDDKAADGFTPGMPTPGGFGDPRISTHLQNGHTGRKAMEILLTFTLR
jgi:hypothetical protein